jgi:tetratricopeptide (TPR) repeat protein
MLIGPSYSILAQAHGSNEAKEMKELSAAELPDHWFELADEAFGNGDYESAIVYHRGVVALDPTYDDSYQLAAWLLWSLGRANEGHEMLDRGIAANPNSAYLWNEVGKQYELESIYEKAAPAFKRSLELDPLLNVPKERTSLLKRYANALEKLGDASGALGVWEILLRENPGVGVIINNYNRVKSGNIRIYQPKK